MLKNIERRVKFREYRLANPIKGFLFGVYFHISRNPTYEIWEK